MPDDLTADLVELELASNSSTGDRGTQAPGQTNLSIQHLRQLTQVDIQSNWHCGGNLFWQAESDRSRIELNTRGHIAWQAGEVLWLQQELIVPATLKGYPLQGKTVRLCLRWWAAQAEIFVNDQLVQAGDLFDCSARILISSRVVAAERFTVKLKLVSPEHDAGALVYAYLVFESNDLLNPDPGFVADELAVLRGYLQTFQPEKLADLDRAVTLIDWSAVENLSQFQGSLAMLRQSLLPFTPWLKQRQILLLGHAHLDLAWLWPVSETWEVAERTFQSALSLQEEFPDWIFCHSSPALYAWVEQHKPDLFAAIQQQVVAGRWEVVAGLWIEPELNLVSGESLVRQVLYGQLYGLEKFGLLSSVAWLPDSFGFCWQLPQILKQGGVEYFVTQKLRWNDTTQFPYEVFRWRSPDGSEIFSVMSPLIGEGIEPVKMAEYAQTWEARTQAKAALWLPGVGDHGGGPTRDMLETVQRWQHSPLFPRLGATTAAGFLANLQAECTDQAVPVWCNELYLEFHRGCYTTHADQKWWNRRCEQLLYQAELFAAVRSLLTGATYPKVELEKAWKQVLFNQFHDILPGSAVPAVFADANRDWAEVQRVGTQILHEAWAAIAREIVLPPAPQPDSQAIVVFNSLNWSRSEVVSLPLQDFDPDQPWQIYDLDGNRVSAQVQTHLDQPTLLFLASDIPSVGYRVFWLAQMPTATASTPQPENYVLENNRLQVVVDPDSGNLARVFDKTQQRQILKGPGNQLQFFQDRGQYWDAWNIDPEYSQHPLPAAQLKTIEWLAWGPLQSRLRVVRQFGQSQFCQDYILEANAAVLRIETTVDWQERQVLVKAAFPLTIEADYATYEIPAGAIQRPTLPNRQPLQPDEAAKWEVPALQWADLSSSSDTGETGVSLLNDGKYGYDAQPDQLRLTLLRSPNWPDPNSDRGFHQFTYALYPHQGSWQAAQTPQRGYELNQPLQVLLHREDAAAKHLPPVGRFLHLQASNLILMALKQAEANPKAWILRCYECYGEPAQLELQSDLNLVISQPVDLLERSIAEPDLETGKIDPWKITSFVVAPRT